MVNNYIQYFYELKEGINYFKDFAVPILSVFIGAFLAFYTNKIQNKKAEYNKNLMNLNYLFVQVLSYERFLIELYRNIEKRYNFYKNSQKIDMKNDVEEYFSVFLVPKTFDINSENYIFLSSNIKALEKLLYNIDIIKLFNMYIYSVNSLYQNILSNSSIISQYYEFLTSDFKKLKNQSELCIKNLHILYEELYNFTVRNKYDIENIKDISFTEAEIETIDAITKI